MSTNGPKDIAIIGMACVYPGAESFPRYWQNIVQKVCAIGDPPPDWEAELFWDPNSKQIDRTYCKRGGWLGPLASFEPFMTMCICDSSFSPRAAVSLAALVNSAADFVAWAFCLAMLSISWSAALDSSSDAAWPQLLWARDSAAWLICPAADRILPD